jgi:hypothetical protein
MSSGPLVVLAEKMHLVTEKEQLATHSTEQKKKKL